MKKFGYRNVYLFFSSALLFIIHIPFVFAKSKPMGKLFFDKSDLPSTVTCTTSEQPGINAAVKFSLYDSLRLGTLGLGRQVFDYAMQGFNCMKAMGKLSNEQIISIVDYSKPSSQKRLFIIDLKNYKILFNTYVAHGMQSGKEFASQFSNTPESNKSSLGFYETLGTYMGGNGYSLRLQGMENGINDNANKRDIVMHGARYVDERLIHSQGYIGRSWGCPAVPPQLNRSIIDKIKNGTCLFIFSQNSRYLSHSQILNSIYTPGYAFNQKS
ncbi:MAG: murein L,D-transpeptidase catalytic domain family protein [Ferruginibacter sp.]|nr:murein L,D-transpeptidase catalytic domain family protein [Ferruginibacter sp.]